MIAFLDLETTGLNPATCAILEVACVIVDDDLREVARFERVVTYSDLAETRAAADPVVQKMHDDNGLWAACAGGKKLPDVAAELLAFLKAHGGERPVLAGNSIYFDRAFLQARMPDVVALLHHRMLDCSSVNVLARWAWPAVYASRPNDGAAHRALPDALHSLQTARYYAGALRGPVLA